MFDGDNRFETVYHKLGFKQSIKVLKDRETGVCYLFLKSGYAGGLTLMVDGDGKPLKM
jgi:hypothetical protein